MHPILVMHAIVRITVAVGTVIRVAINAVVVANRRLESIRKFAVDAPEMLESIIFG